MIECVAQLALGVWKCSSLVVPEHQVVMVVETVETNAHLSVRTELWLVVRQEMTVLRVLVSSDIELLVVSDVPRLQLRDQLGLYAFVLLFALQVGA